MTQWRQFTCNQMDFAFLLGILYMFWRQFQLTFSLFFLLHFCCSLLILDCVYGLWLLTNTICIFELVCPCGTANSFHKNKHNRYSIKSKHRADCFVSFVCVLCAWIERASDRMASHYVSQLNGLEQCIANRNINFVLYQFSFVCITPIWLPAFIRYHHPLSLN